MGDYLIIAGVILGCAAAVLLTALRLPGTWLLVAGAVATGWLTSWEVIGFKGVAVLFVIALAAELVEVGASAVTSRRAGGSRRAAVGAVIGGFLGMIFLSFLIPILFVGSIVGAVVGCFLGAAMAEMTVRSHVSHGARVGLWAAMGFALGTAAKVGFALIMSAILVADVWSASPRGPAPESPAPASHNAPLQE